MKEDKTLIIFPPYMPQFYIFPYLSVPLITGYLSKRGYLIDQRDLNLEFFNWIQETRKIEHIADSYQQELSSCMKPNDKMIEKYLEARFVADNFHWLKDDASNARRLAGVLERWDARFGVVPEVNEFTNIENLATKENPYQEYFENHVLPSIKDMGYRITCFSVAMGQQIISTLWLARMLCEALPDTHIVLGGAAINLLDENSLLSIAKLKYINTMIKFGGAGTLKKVIDNIQNTGMRTHDIPNIIDCDHQPISFPSQYKAIETTETSDLLFDSKQALMYPHGFSFLPIYVTLGCYWGKCSFCSYVNIGNSEYMEQDVIIVVDQMEYLQKRYGTAQFRLITEALPPEYCEPLADEILKRNLKVGFSTFLKVDNKITKALLRKMKSAGLYEIEIGVETLNPRLLKLMRKGCTREMIIQQMQWAREEKIAVVISFIVDFPSETLEESIQDAHDLYAICDSNVDISILPYGLIKGTYTAQHPEEFGLEIVEDVKSSESLGHEQGVLLAIPYIDKKGMSKQEKLQVFDLHRSYSKRVRKRLLREKLLILDPVSWSLYVDWSKFVEFVRSYIVVYTLKSKSLGRSYRFFIYNFLSKKVAEIEPIHNHLYNTITNSQESNFELFVSKLVAHSTDKYGHFEESMLSFIYHFILPFHLPFKANAHNQRLSDGLRQKPYSIPKEQLARHNQ